jgi:hypothetical protein
MNCGVASLDGLTVFKGGTILAVDEPYDVEIPLRVETVQIGVSILGISN